MSTESSFSRITYGIADGIATITFARPERMNALDYAAEAELLEALELADADNAVRAVVITGQGRAFCAGADVKQWSDRLTGEGDEASIDNQTFQRLNERTVTTLFNFPKPMIASVNGAAVGMGMDIALAADLRIASSSARFGMLYTRIGTVPDFGGTFYLPRLIGLTKATELILTGRIIDAQEANALGLLNELVPPDELETATLTWARRLASGPTFALSVAKRNLREAVGTTFDVSHRAEVIGHQLCITTDDHREGVAATAEGRDARFIGH
jgi:2-(1,2-epoxy-1,2-dihydrophenyl)acetyl-CoA isomerase